MEAIHAMYGTGEWTKSPVNLSSCKTSQLDENTIAVVSPTSHISIKLCKLYMKLSVFLSHMYDYFTKSVNRGMVLFNSELHHIWILVLIEYDVFK